MQIRGDSPGLTPRRAARESAAVGIIMGGAIGLITVAFLAHPLAGWAALSATMVAVGVVMGAW